MQNLLITLAYLGTRYHGFQVQKNAPSVAQVFQDAVQQIYGERLPIKGCSRTDAGVHANEYCLSMQLSAAAQQRKISCEGLIKALNTLLPTDICVYSCTPVEPSFHARYACKGKRYLYKFYDSKTPNPFLEGRAYYCKTRTPLDAQLMHTAAAHFVGTHDFTSFCAAGGSVEDKTRTITAASVQRIGDEVIFSVTGNGFLYNMVRIMAGTLLAVAKKNLEPAAIPSIIAAQNRKQAGVTMPPHGLYLDKVFY